MGFEAVEQLGHDQGVYEDLHKQVDKEVKFITLPDGQWEENVRSSWGENRPRYTFDLTGANIAKAWAEMAQNEYVATTSPAGGESSEEVSEVIDGILRETYERSSFDSMSAFIGKRMIAVGEGSWRVVTEYEPGTFNQRFKIVPLHDSHDRVWWDSHSLERERQDANHVNITTYISDAEVRARWNKRRDIQSVSTKRSMLSDINRPDDRKLIAEQVSRKPYTVDLYQMIDGSVITGEELEALNIDPSNKDLVINSRKETRYKIYSQHYDNNDWLEDKRELAFNMLPVVSLYANWSVLDGKCLYHGMVRNIMDHARVYNYIQSRKVEDSVLGLPDVMMIPDVQARGYTEKLSRMNRSPNRVQVYKGVDGLPPPMIQRGSQPSPALSEISADMINSMQLTTGLPMTLAEMQAQGTDSNARAARRDTIGRMGTYEYYKAYSIGLELTSRIIIGAIPRVIDNQRKLKTISETGVVSEVDVNTTKPNGEIVNDLRKGDYDVTVTVGASLKDRQAEANTAILEAASIDPTIISRNTDVIAGNISAPGMKEVSDRERAYQFKAGNIPEDQWTDGEREQMQAAAQNQQPDPATLIAQAELERSRTEAETAQAKMLEAQAKLELAQVQQQTNSTISALKLQLQEREMQLKERQQIIDEQKADTENLLNVSKSIESLAKTDQTIDNQTLDKVEGNI